MWAGKMPRVNLLVPALVLHLLWAWILVLLLGLLLLCGVENDLRELLVLELGWDIPLQLYVALAVLVLVADVVGRVWRCLRVRRRDGPDGGVELQGVGIV